MAEKEKPLPTPPSLIGKHIYLRPTTLQDAMNIHYWFVQSEPQTQSCHPLPYRTASEVSRAAESSEGTPDRQNFTIVRKEDDVAVGQVSFFNYNALNRSAEMGVLIDPDQRKEGYGSEAMKVLIQHLFKFRDLNKVYGYTPEFNDAAVALLESLGFKNDGALRNHHFCDGEYHDQLIYSLLRFEMNW